MGIEQANYADVWPGRPGTAAQAKAQGRPASTAHGQGGPAPSSGTGFWVPRYLPAEYRRRRAAAAAAANAPPPPPPPPRRYVVLEPQHASPLASSAESLDACALSSFSFSGGALTGSHDSAASLAWSSGVCAVPTGRLDMPAPLARAPDEGFQGRGALAAPACAPDAGLGQCHQRWSEQPAGASLAPPAHSALDDCAYLAGPACTTALDGCGLAPAGAWAGGAGDAWRPGAPLPSAPAGGATPGALCAAQAAVAAELGELFAVGQRLAAAMAAAPAGSPAAATCAAAVESYQVAVRAAMGTSARLQAAAAAAAVPGPWRLAVSAPLALADAAGWGGGGGGASLVAGLTQAACNSVAHAKLAELAEIDQLHRRVQVELISLLPHGMAAGPGWRAMAREGEPDPRSRRGAPLSAADAARAALAAAAPPSAPGTAAVAVPSMPGAAAVAAALAAAPPGFEAALAAVMLRRVAVGEATSVRAAHEGLPAAAALTGAASGSSSSFRGVTQHKRTRRWEVGAAPARRARTTAAGRASARRRRVRDDAPAPLSPHRSRRRRSQAHIWLNKKQVYLGGFVDEVQAAKAHDVMALKSRGRGAALNFALPAQVIAALRAAGRRVAAVAAKPAPKAPARPAKPRRRTPTGPRGASPAPGPQPATPGGAAAGSQEAGGGARGAGGGGASPAPRSHGAVTSGLGVAGGGVSKPHRSPISGGGPAAPRTPGAPHAGGAAPAPAQPGAPLLAGSLAFIQVDAAGSATNLAPRGGGSAGLSPTLAGLLGGGGGHAWLDSRDAAGARFDSYGHGGGWLARGLGGPRGLPGEAGRPPAPPLAPDAPALGRGWDGGGAAQQLWPLGGGRAWAGEAGGGSGGGRHRAAVPDPGHAIPPLPGLPDFLGGSAAPPHGAGDLAALIAESRLITQALHGGGWGRAGPGHPAARAQQPRAFAPPAAAAAAECGLAHEQAAYYGHALHAAQARAQHPAAAAVLAAARPTWGREPGREAEAQLLVPSLHQRADHVCAGSLDSILSALRGAAGTCVDAAAPRGHEGAASAEWAGFAFTAAARGGAPAARYGAEPIDPRRVLAGVPLTAEEEEATAQLLARRAAGAAPAGGGGGGLLPLFSPAPLPPRSPQLLPPEREQRPGAAAAPWEELLAELSAGSAAERGHAAAAAAAEAVAQAESAAAAAASAVAPHPGAPACAAPAMTLGSLMSSLQAHAPQQHAGAAAETAAAQPHPAPPAMGPPPPAAPSADGCALARAHSLATSTHSLPSEATAMAAAVLAGLGNHGGGGRSA
ncbi:hypothetical protein HT031_003782 [Scenedesmus sp. PABB004]|nr:hypothetical protein HT031_003782 [Scenedesmus sp. PABB004]